MFKTLKILWLKFRTDYHHNLVTYYDHKSYKRKKAGYSGMFYRNKAWRHLAKEIELTGKLFKLYKLKGT